MMLNFTLPPFAVTSKKQLLCNYSVPFGLNIFKKIFDPTIFYNFK